MSCPIVIAQELSGPNHFAGVDDALRDRGAEAAWTILEEAPGRLGDDTRVVAVSDVRSFLALGVLRRAQRVGACTVLLMDGITEYRNTFLNPRVPAGFLRPAPVDVVACAGRADALRLRGLGNDSVATGLPRLAGIEPMPLPRRPAILVATARQPAFSDEERRQLALALITLRDRLASLGITARWRLTGGMEQEVGVQPDTAPLAESLLAVSAVITTPSTLLVEAMRAGRPVALLHPFDAPCWPQAASTIDTLTLSSSDRLDGVLGSLVEPDDQQWLAQARALDEMHQQQRPPAHAVAELLLELVERPRRKTRPAHLVDPTRLPERVHADPDRIRVVSLVRCDLSPVGGVTTWSKRLARAFAEHDLAYDVRTLLIVTHPDSMPPPGADDDGLTRVCVVDPMADHWQAVRTVRQALERLEPSIVLPNYADLCYAAAMQLRPHGVRTIAIAHSDHASCREVIAAYDRWDGAAGVSAACMRWLEPIAGERPAARIVYGVPVADAPRTMEPQGPMKLAYIGRMVESQKRISDLLTLMDGLEARAVPFVFHIVGDGEDMDGWRKALAERRLEGGRVIIHGRRSARWVEEFLGEIDVSVLVSDFEGTSITMLEAMGAGVVPAVTRVASGVDEWVRDGANGIVVPIGEPDRMAERLADVAGDRSRLAAMGRAAWETVRGEISVEATARRYRDLFDRVMDRPLDPTPTDVGLRLCDRYTWRKEWVEHTDEALVWIESALREAGYRRIAIGAPTADCDAVIVRADDANNGDDIAGRVAEYRRRGLGVAVWPHLLEATVTDRMHHVVKGALDKGCRRIAIYGVGRHTRRTAGIFQRGLPLVGLIDDDPPSRDQVFGLPVVPLDRAMSELKPDAVLLSSDAWEEQMWSRSAPLRAAGVRVLPLYGTYSD
ncbi:MAG: glycosyltransferase family 4 protein [Planctomycetota bacterium]|jgi:glycosyltransferase involved in cell wall biosynthesis